MYTLTLLNEGLYGMDEKALISLHKMRGDLSSYSLHHCFCNFGCFNINYNYTKVFPIWLPIHAGDNMILKDKLKSNLE